MASLSIPETPTVNGYSVAVGNGVIYLQLAGVQSGFAVGGSLALSTARELARTILAVTGEESGDGK